MTVARCRSWTWVLLYGVVATRSGWAGDAPVPSRPNFVVIVSDDQGYADLGCAGSPDARTPNLDRLAREGRRLTSFYAAWPACTPSRASLLTGRYPQRNGTSDMIRNDIIEYGHQFTPEEYAVSPEAVLGTDTREIFVSDVLAGLGYRNACFGKWDGGQLRRFLPLQRGFHQFYGFTNTGIDYFTHERYGVPSMRSGNERTQHDRGVYCTDLFRRAAVQFLREHARQPFFLYLPFNAPHAASSLDPDVRGTVQAPAEYLAHFTAGDTESAQRRRGYLAALECLDSAVGEVLRTLDELQLTERTFVFFMSDNGGGGGSQNQPLRGRKSQMFEGGLRVASLARWPGRIPAGTVGDELLTALELFPTIVRAAGGQLPADVVYDGFDMLPVLAGEQPSRREEMFWQRRTDRAARVGDWKWIANAQGELLFDLASDLGEQHNLITQQPATAARLRDRFARWQAEMAAAEPRGPFRDY